jgi:hypothetical protein
MTCPWDGTRKLAGSANSEPNLLRIHHKKKGKKLRASIVVAFRKASLRIFDRLLHKILKNYWPGAWCGWAGLWSHNKWRIGNHGSERWVFRCEHAWTDRIEVSSHVVSPAPVRAHTHTDGGFLPKPRPSIVRRVWRPAALAACLPINPRSGYYLCILCSKTYSNCNIYQTAKSFHQLHYSCLQMRPSREQSQRRQQQLERPSHQRSPP